MIDGTMLDDKMHPDPLCSVVMDTPGFTEEALLVALSHDGQRCPALCIYGYAGGVVSIMAQELPEKALPSSSVQIAHVKL